MKTSFSVNMLRYRVVFQMVMCLISRLWNGVGANTYTQFIGKGVPSNLEELDIGVSVIILNFAMLVKVCFVSFNIMEC